MRLTLSSKTTGAHDDALWAVVWNQIDGSVLTGQLQPQQHYKLLGTLYAACQLA